MAYLFFVFRLVSGLLAAGVFFSQGGPFLRDAAFDTSLFPFDQPISSVAPGVSP